MISRRRTSIALGCLFVLVAIYGLMGFFQGIMLFTGERALRNANLWGSVFLLATTASAYLFLAARIPRSPPSPRFLLAGRTLSAVALAMAVWVLLPIFRDEAAIDSCLD